MKGSQKTSQPTTVQFSSEQLQAMYESALWYGYVTRDEVRYYEHDLLLMAKEQGVELVYWCPA